MASNNDCGVRDFDMEKFQLSKHFSFSWPVNVSLYLVKFLILYKSSCGICFFLIESNLVSLSIRNPIIVGVSKAHRWSVGVYS